MNFLYFILNNHFVCNLVIEIEIEFMYIIEMYVIEINSGIYFYYEKYF